MSPHLTKLGVEIASDLDVPTLRDRFEVFEALHHTMTICNPMTSDELDDVIAAAAVVDGDHVVDFGCGYGELLIRVASKAGVTGTGVDLSPWMLQTAAQRAIDLGLDRRLRWSLAEARDFVSAVRPDVAICIGAEWIWHDLAGTARALAQRTNPGARVAIGAPRLHFGPAAQAAAAQRGRIETVDELTATLESAGFRALHRVDPDDAGWDAYLDRTRLAALDWAQRHPGARADRWLEEQADWQSARERDRKIIGWSVWIAERRQGGH